MRLTDFMEGEEVTIIDREVSPIYEASLILKRLDGGPIVLFRRIRGYSMQVVGNVVGSRRRLLKCLGVKSYEEAYSKLVDSMERPTKPTEETGFENYYSKLEGGLERLPVLKYYENDAGRYITSSIVVACFEGICNASVHRLLVLDKERAAIRIVPRHLYALYMRARDEGKDLPVAVIIGCHPSILLAAAASPPFGVNELWVANKILNGNMRVVATPKYGILVPIDAEIVAEGVIKAFEEVDEGPFADITGTYDAVRKQPVLQLDGIYVNSEAVYQAILPASVEHRLLMGFPKEAEIWNSLRRVITRLRAVRLTEGGCGWLHAVIAIDKVTEGDAKTAIMAAFGAHPSLKHVVVVDSDVNIDDLRDVEWAIATRFQADRGLVVVRNARGSSLDPSADPETLLTCKVGVDATKPLRGDIKRFERARIPMGDQVEVK
ncbi:MAG: UbiD family decarboxylase [Candidatus Nezhaarchaeota archaeon]|nr:UbiD family decarboxylase [Candidatus Nezhaarchaeota archaeon]MCX8141717.1 UbiD family decarboxylase [Candidatus Nezhaarchaeota archaeon]MDW8049984.1 UbiD family decarboxylase [Nitrososphaerota archaeon]